MFDLDNVDEDLSEGKKNILGFNIKVKKKYLKIVNLVLLLILIIFGLFYAFYIKYLQVLSKNSTNNSNYKNDLIQIEDLNTDIDNHILSGIDSLDESEFIFKGNNNNIISSTGDQGEEVNNEMQNLSGVLEEVDIQELKNDYTKAILKGDDLMQLFLLEKMYENTKNIDYVYVIIDKLIEKYDFKNAFKYVQILDNNEENIRKLGIEKFFYILINSAEYNDKNIQMIATLITHYWQKKDIDNASYYYYNSLISLFKLDFKNFEEKISLIGTGNYDQFIDDINIAKIQFDSYKDAPDYYYKGLISFILFQHGYFNIAQRISTQITKISSKYILPYQVIAYSSFIVNNYDDSKKYFHHLISIDHNNADQYKFLLGISHFWNEKYSDSVVYLSQIQSEENKKDAYRYLILSYYKLGDTKKLVEYFNNLLKTKYLNEYDYYYFFDIFFFKPWEKNEDFDLFQNESSIAVKYIKSCYDNLSSSSKYICYYGKAGFYIAKGQRHIALKYLKYLEKFFQRSYIYKTIGDVYFETKKLDIAKKYYIKAILSTEDLDKRKEIKQNLVNVFIKKSEK